MAVYKPVASGCRLEHGRLVNDDAEQLAEAAGWPETIERVCPQAFLAPLAPHLAARAEGNRVDERLLVAGLEPWADQYDVAVVEGAGGLFSPISDTLYVADLALEFGYPLVIVAANALGVINQVLQTRIAARAYRKGLTVAGVVLNDVLPDEPSNMAAGEAYGSHSRGNDAVGDGPFGTTITSDLSRRSNLDQLRAHAANPHIGPPCPVLAHVAHRGSLGTSVDWWKLSGEP